MVTAVCQAKKTYHRVSAYIEAHLVYLVAMFNVLLALYHQLPPDQPAHNEHRRVFALGLTSTIGY
jgi:hypothetical protein